MPSGIGGVGDAGGNLGCRGQTMRLRDGVFLFAIAFVATAAMLEGGAGHVARAALFVPYVLFANLLFQGLHRTCAGLAMAGRRDAGDGPEPIVDPVERARIRKIGVRTLVDAALVAALMTVLVELVA